MFELQEVKDEEKILKDLRVKKRTAFAFSSETMQKESEAFELLKEKRKYLEFYIQ